MSSFTSANGLVGRWRERGRLLRVLLLGILFRLTHVFDAGLTVGGGVLLVLVLLLCLLFLDYIVTPFSN